MSLLIAYLDEFGHIGPYISRDHPQHKTSPVFGFAGYIIPAERVRDFAAWFFSVKNALLDWELKNSGLHPANFEKKGSALYTTQNIEKYAELRRFTLRFLRAFARFDAKIFYVGVEKRRDDPPTDNPDGLYQFVLREAIKRVNQEAEARESKFLMVLDEHASRERVLTTAGISMFGTGIASHMLEPPFQVESHRFQTIQAADWVCGIIGRLAAYRADKDGFGEFAWAHEKYRHEISEAAIRSGIRSLPKAA